MEKSWEITLADGTQLKNLGLNGNNFVSESEITKDDFKGKLSKVKIEGTAEDGREITEEHEHMELVQIAHYEDGYYFVLRDITDAEIEKKKIKADIDYIAMMSDIDLELEGE